MKFILSTIVYIVPFFAHMSLAQSDQSSLSAEAMIELRNIVVVAEKEKPPYSDFFKSELENSIQNFEKKYQTEAKADKDLLAVLIRSHIIRLDTSLFSVSISQKSAEVLVDLIQQGDLNADPMMMMGLVGRMSTANPTPVYSERVRVLKAFVDGYFQKNEISDFKSLESSGNGFLIYALNANKQYGEAAHYHKQMLNFIESKNMNVNTYNLYEEQIRLEVFAENPETAISTMEDYIQSNEQLINDINIRVHTAKVFSEIGNETRATAILDPLNLVWKEDEIHEESRYEALFDVTEAYSLIGAEDQSIEWLNKLMVFLQQNESNWRYTSMYYKTEDLLEKLNQTELLAKLTKPEDRE